MLVPLLNRRWKRPSSVSPESDSFLPTVAASAKAIRAFPPENSAMVCASTSESDGKHRLTSFSARSGDDGSSAKTSVPSGSSSRMSY
jgi:hypothetical protein